MKRYLITLIAFLLYQASDAQAVVSISESIYLAEEKIAIKVENHRPGETLYLGIKDRNGMILTGKFVSSELSSFETLLDVPRSFESGTYILVGQLPGQSNVLSSKQINLVNPESFQISDDPTDERRIFKTTPAPGLPLIEGKTSPNQLVILQSRGDHWTTLLTRSDDSGNFRFDNLTFGKSQILISTESTESEVDLVTVNSNPKRSNASLDPVPFDNNQDLRNSIQSILIADKQENKSQDQQMEINTSYTFNADFRPEAYNGIQNIEEFLRNAVIFKKLRISKRTAEIYLTNLEKSLFFKVQPLMLIDGFRVNSIQDFLDIPLEDLLSIKVSNYQDANVAIFGRLAFGGSMSLHTKEGDYVPENGLFQDFEAVHLVR